MIKVGHIDGYSFYFQCWILFNFLKIIVIGFEYNIKQPKQLYKYMYMTYVDGAYYITSNCSWNVYMLEENMREIHNYDFI